MRKKNKRPVWQTIIMALLLAALAIEVFIFLIFFGLFGELPSTDELRNPSPELASGIYSADGELIGKFYSKSRLHVTPGELSPYLQQALIATEDERFFRHEGIDLRSVGRVFIKTIILGKKEEGGGSTITQQLAKNLFPRKKDDTYFHLFVSKMKEWMMAARLENNHSKEELLTMYFNVVPFSQNQYGVKAASLTFFNKPPDSLKIEEAALLIGTLKATTTFDPVRNPGNALVRRNKVLNKMAESGYIEKETRDSLKAIPLELDFNRIDQEQGIAAYFRAFIRERLTEWLKNNPANDGKAYNIYTDGLKIYTTLDSRMQKHAEDALKNHLTHLQHQFYRHWQHRAPWSSDPGMIEQAMKNSRRYKLLKSRGLSEEEIKKEFKEPVKMKVFTWNGTVEKEMTPLDSIRHYLMILRGGFIAMDPYSGHIKAWVGGYDHRFVQYDHVLSKRQVGSVFKPFVYAAAINQGWNPCDFVDNQPVTFARYKDWSPRNASGSYGGKVTVQQGLSSSINTVTAYLMKEVGMEPVIRLAYKAGIETDIKKVPSIALGTSDLSLYEIVRAYLPFVNKGFAVKPIAVTRIEDKNGNLIYEFLPEKKKVISEGTAYITLRMMQNAVEEGTGSHVRYTYSLYNEIAGKTGTTQKHADGWFIGMVPQLVAGTWIGGENRSIRFRSLKLGSGSNMALPVWAKFMRKVYNDPELDISRSASFDKPSAGMNIEFDCEPFIPDTADTFAYDTSMYLSYWEMLEKKYEELFNKDKDTVDKDKNRIRDSIKTEIKKYKPEEAEEGKVEDEKADEKMKDKEKKGVNTGDKTEDKEDIEKKKDKEEIEKADKKANEPDKDEKNDPDEKEKEQEAEEDSTGRIGVKSGKTGSRVDSNQYLKKD